MTHSWAAIWHIWNPGWRKNSLALFSSDERKGGGVYNGSVRQTSYNFRRKRKPRFSLFLYSFSPVWTSGQNLQFYILQFLLKWYTLSHKKKHITFWEVQHFVVFQHKVYNVVTLNLSPSCISVSSSTYSVVSLNPSSLHIAPRPLPAPSSKLQHLAAAAIQLNSLRNLRQDKTYLPSSIEWVIGGNAIIW